MDINKALSEGTNDKGGFTVPEIWASKIYNIVQEKSIMIPFCEQVEMKSDTWYAPTVTAGSTAYWPAELGTITGSDLTFGQVTLTAKKVASKVQLSTELAEDSLVDVMKIVSGQMAEDIALDIDSAIINGNGHFTGMRAAAGNDVAASGADGDAITHRKILDAIYAGAADKFKYDTMVCNPRTIRDLRALTDSTGRPLYDMITMDSPLYKTGVLGVIEGLKVFETTSVPINLTKGGGTTLTDVIVFKTKKCGIFGLRRKMTAHKFYDIDDDSWYLQVNTRVGHTVPYANAICTISNLT
jgi:HK97 family phage major capsid protein